MSEHNQGGPDQVNFFFTISDRNIPYKEIIKSEEVASLASLSDDFHNNSKIRKTKSLKMNHFELHAEPTQPYLVYQNESILDISNPVLENIDDARVGTITAILVPQIVYFHNPEDLQIIVLNVLELHIY